MKQIIVTIAFFISAFTFAQNTGSINGSLLDIESNNEPLIMAKVSIKETGAEVLSDYNGVFKFENLAEGTYTLVLSFIGYETKQYETNVVTNKSTNVKLHLAASTISLDDLMFTLASADSKGTSTASNN
ncbi:MAG: carboxypeptidase-like regulatory domain-containing protein [Flaviramulus sp.]|nr:carboxypeptidase-like regulatory domain-containing protein [Flaviramulus sp.]NNC51284.1 carboxypeptidase-like regulatory domain-containing protein [Flaviramulus sp.]